MRSSPPLCAALLLVLGAAPARAAVECQMDESVTACWTRTFNALDAQQPAQVEEMEDQEQELEDQEQGDLRSLPTGVDTGGTTLQSNTKNFLPLVALSGLVGDAEQGDAEGTYVFDLNFLIPGLAKDKNAQLQAAVNSRPQVSEALAMTIPEEMRDDTVAKLQEGLGDLDDYALSFTYNWADRRRGRGFKQYEDRFAALTWALSRKLKTPARDEDRQRALGDFVGSIQDDFPEVDDLFTTPFDQIGDEDKARELKEATEAALEQATELLAQHRQALAASGLARFAELLDNQPQLYASVQQRYRDPVVGGDQTAAKVTYGYGLANFNNAMNRACHDALDTPDTKQIDEATLDRCLTQYTAFVKGNLDGIADADKLSFSGEYVDLSDDRVDRPDLGLGALDLPGGTKLIVSAGWTRNFPAGRGGQPLRLDLVASYEDVSDDPARQDRGVATLTVTRQFGNLAIPFGIVYATKGEFLGQVDRQLSAHLGLKFNLFGNAPGTAGTQPAQ